jgi:uncharacterized protein
MDINQQISKELSLKPNQVKTAIELLDSGNTVPFIARYRKEMTGEMTDVQLRDLQERLTYLRNLAQRKDDVIRLIEEQGKLTKELQTSIEQADTLQRVEDLYRPYKQKKQTRATKAKAKGLEPLAERLMAQVETEGNPKEWAKAYLNEELEVLSVEDAIKGAMDILAEQVADDPDMRKEIRAMTWKEGAITSKATDPDEVTVFETYYDFKENLNTMANHRVLAINRGEKEKKLKVKLLSPHEKILSWMKGRIITNPRFIGMEILLTMLQDAYKRLLQPAIERDLRKMLTDRADESAIEVFSKNAKSLFLIAPIRDAVVMGFDPAYRTGCKIAIVDDTGKLLEFTTVYPTMPLNKVEETKKTLKKMIRTHGVNLIAIGNGTGSRESESIVAEMIGEMDETVYYTIVNEAGASVYSASKLAHDEYPDINVSIRGAISIARRLQDPLAELVKIDPKSVGVGQYQHDVNQKRLGESLNAVVEDCVNHVGVDLNTASASLLSYVSGINGTIAKNMISYRETNGKFMSRKAILKVPRLGPKVFEQCAGFLRVIESKNPLDQTAVHPESYQAVERLLGLLGYTQEDVRNHRLEDMNQRIDRLVPKEKRESSMQTKGSKRLHGLDALKQISFEDPKKSKRKDQAQHHKKSMRFLSEQLEIGIPTLVDMMEELKKPGRDPREDMPKPIFRSDVLKMEDLQVGMEVLGTVRNIIDFGAFVDIGVKQDGLVHISELSDKYVRDAMTVVSIGDTVRVKIIGVDQKRGRISLSMKGIKQPK